MRLELEGALTDEAAVLAVGREEVSRREHAVQEREATVTALLDQAILVEQELASMLQQTSEREQQLGRAVEGAEQWMLKAQAATRQAEKLTAAVEREAEYVGRRALELQATAQRRDKRSTLRNKHRRVPRRRPRSPLRDAPARGRRVRGPDGAIKSTAPRPCSAVHRHPTSPRCSAPAASGM